MRRRNRAQAKLEPSRPTQTTPRPPSLLSGEPESVGLPDTAGQPSAFEVLTCSSCGRSFERPRVRGRKPSLCPTSRQTTP